jgi:AraC family transcriptional regulator
MKDNRAFCGYHGEFIKSRVVNGLPLMEATYAPNLELPKHSHRHAGFCLILEGGYTESYAGALLECKAPYVKFQPAGELHSDLYGTHRVHSFIVELEAGWLARMRACALVEDRPALFRDSSIAWLMMRLRKEFLSTDDAAPLAIEGLLLELIAATSRTRARVSERDQPRWLRQAKEVLHDRFREPVRLHDLAQSVGVHPVYLANSFRLRYGCSIGEYLRRLRIEYACQRISRTDSSLVDIALSAGFSSQSHFSRIFKRVTGMTPARYRSTTRLS